MSRDSNQQSLKQHGYCKAVAYVLPLRKSELELSVFNDENKNKLFEIRTNELRHSETLQIFAHPANWLVFDDESDLVKRKSTAIKRIHIPPLGIQRHHFNQIKMRYGEFRKSTEFENWPMPKIKGFRFENSKPPPI